MQLRQSHAFPVTGRAKHCAAKLGLISVELIPVNAYLLQIASGARQSDRLARPCDLVAASFVTLVVPVLRNQQVLATVKLMDIEEASGHVPRPDPGGACHSTRLASMLQQEAPVPRTVACQQLRFLAAHAMPVRIDARHCPSGFWLLSNRFPFSSAAQQVPTRCRKISRRQILAKWKLIGFRAAHIPPNP